MKWWSQFKKTSAHPVQCGGLQDCSGAASLPDGVHAQLRGTNVHSSQTQLGGQHGADGAATCTVVAHHYLLTGSKKTKHSERSHHEITKGRQTTTSDQCRTMPELLA